MQRASVRSSVVSLTLTAFVAIVSACREDVDYSCEAWCGSDFSTLTRLPFRAADEGDANTQCFDATRDRCKKGAIPKCKCMTGSTPSAGTPTATPTSPAPASNPCDATPAAALDVEQCTFTADSGTICSGACAGNKFRCASPQSSSLIGCAAERVVCCADGAHGCPVGTICTKDNTCTAPNCGSSVGACECLSAAAICPDPRPEPSPPCCPASMPYRTQQGGCITKAVYPATQACADVCGVSL